MRWIAIMLVFVTPLCYANHCPDSRMKQAAIGGDTIDGSVRLRQRLSPCRETVYLKHYFNVTVWALTGRLSAFPVYNA
jgi:hypothetical protein